MDKVSVYAPPEFQSVGTLAFPTGQTLSLGIPRRSTQEWCLGGIVFALILEVGALVKGRA